MNISQILRNRDYNSYARQMEYNITEKYLETAPLIIPGRIGDIGCANGSWLRCAIADPRLEGSEFHGIELSPVLYDICEQRKLSGAFSIGKVMFSCKDAASDMMFMPNSMDTIHTSSLTHELRSQIADSHIVDYIEKNPCSRLVDAYSTVGERQVKQFMVNRYTELRSGGIWINRDVVGPAAGEKQVYLDLSKNDGRNNDFERDFALLDRHGLSLYLNGLSTFARFLRFTRDYRRYEGYKVQSTHETVNGRHMVCLSLNDAWEFATKKDYVDNWWAEMHESFCFWSFEDWVNYAQAAGFDVLPASRVYTNGWIVANRLERRVMLLSYDSWEFNTIPYPPTNMILALRKP